MARRSNKDGDAVSLFPFLSILACIIGILMLMIVSNVLGQLDRTSVDEVAAALREQEERDKTFESVQEQMQIDKEKLEELRRLVADAEAARQRLSKELAELKRIEAETKKVPAGDDPAAKLLLEANRLRLRIEEMQAELPKRREEVTKIKQELAKRKEPVKEAQIRVGAGGSGVGLRPTFIECTAADVVVHKGAQPQRIRVGDLANHEAFALLLDTIAEKANESLIFLIRPDGVYTYHLASRLAREHGARNGKLPLNGQGKLDLSLFADVTQ